jgi:hypothetical protein
MTVAEQWRRIGSELPADWTRVDLRLQLPDRGAANDASAALAPAGPLRMGPTFVRFTIARDGSAVGPDNATRLLSRIPRGTLTIASSDSAAPPTFAVPTPLVEAWDTAFAGLPADWSDAFAELQLTSTDFIEKASVLCIQTNPRRVGDEAALRFRVARLAGYGVAPGMARRCLERCDEQGVTGTLVVLRVLSDTAHVGTQGPSWILDGQTI